MTRRAAIVIALTGLLALPAHAAWEGYERMTRDSLLLRLKDAGGKTPLDLYAKNFSDLDLRGIDFRGANVSASVFNGAQLQQARFDGSNLTVAFFEGTDLSGASLQGAIMFSVQMAGSTLRDANLTGARLIGDLRKVALTNAKLVHQFPFLKKDW